MKSGKAETPIASKAEDAQTQKESDLNSLRVKVAELCPTLFAVHETWRDGKLVQYVSWKDDEYSPLEIKESEWLAACAEFEKGLTDEQHVKYRSILFKLAGGIEFVDSHVMHGSREFVSATAEQPCRAFVAVMEGKEK